MMQAYLMDENTLLVPRRVRIGPDDPEWKMWREKAVPVPKCWGGKVRPMFLLPAGQRGRLAALPEPKPEPPPPTAPPIVVPVWPLPTDRLTPAEVATMVRHTETTVLRWCLRGIITPANIGRRVFVLRSEVERFLAHGSAIKLPKHTRNRRTKKEPTTKKRR